MNLLFWVLPICGYAQLEYFSCGDISIPMDFVNDDYCDCALGEDEYRTAACSNTDMEFSCKNDHYVQKSIPTMFVNDGICDCCDGSDEWMDSNCSNTCAVKAERKRVQVNDYYQVVKAGNAVRKEYVRKVELVKKENSKASMKTEKEMKAWEELKTKVQVLKEREEKKEHRARIEKARKQNSPVELQEDTCDTEKVEEYESLTVKQVLNKKVVLSNGSEATLATFMKLQYVQNKDNDQVGDMKRNGFMGPLINRGTEGYKAAGTLFLQVLGITLLPVQGVLRAVSKLWYYADMYMWQNITDDYRWTMEETMNDMWLTAENTKDSCVQYLRTAANGDIWKVVRYITWGAQTIWNGPAELYEYFDPVIDKYFIRSEAKSLRSILSMINKEMEEIQKAQGNLNATFEQDFGQDDAFYILDKTCIDKKIEKYNYKFCFFAQLHQDSTLVGTFSEWQDSTSMKYINGLSCYNGPARSAHVSFVCGLENKILEIEEVSVCYYSIQIATPALCTPQLLEKAFLEMKKWN